VAEAKATKDVAVVLTHNMKLITIIRHVARLPANQPASPTGVCHLPLTGAFGFISSAREDF